MAQASEYMRQDIKSYLDKLASEDATFAPFYANPAKSIEECCDFICTQVQKSGVHGFHDDEIYGMAVHYYQEEGLDITAGLSGRCNIVTNHHIELTEEEKEAAKQKALDEIIATEKRKIQEKEKREREAAKAKAEEKKKQEQAEGLLDLFGEE